MNTTDEYIPCNNDCDEGRIEVMNCSMGTASGCCGGCYEYIPCPSCEGAGEILNENYEPNEN